MYTLKNKVRIIHTSQPSCMVSRRESRLSSSGAFPKVIIKSDFLEAIRLVSSQYDPNHPYIDIMHQIVVGASFHRHIVFSFAHREFNNVADWVENEALSFPLGNLVFSSPFRCCHRLSRLDAGDRRVYPLSLLSPVLNFSQGRRPAM